MNLSHQLLMRLVNRRAIEIRLLNVTKQDQPLAVFLFEKLNLPHAKRAFSVVEHLNLKATFTSRWLWFVSCFQISGHPNFAAKKQTNKNCPNRYSDHL